MFKKIKEFDAFLDTLTPLFLILLFTVAAYIPKFSQPLWNSSEVQYLLAQTVPLSLTATHSLPIPLFFIQIPLSVTEIRILFLLQVLILELLIFAVVRKLFSSNILGYIFVTLFATYTVFATLPQNQNIDQYYQNWIALSTGKIDKQTYHESFDITANDTYKILKLLYNQE